MFKPPKKPTSISAGQLQRETFTQSKASMQVPGLDKHWARTKRNAFLRDEITAVNATIKTAKRDKATNRLEGAYQYIEKDATDSSKLHYMVDFVPLDIYEHKVNIALSNSSRQQEMVRRASPQQAPPRQTVTGGKQRTKK